MITDATYRLQTDITYYITSSQGVLFIEPAKKILANKAASWLFKTGERVVKTGTIRVGQDFDVMVKGRKLWVRHPKIMGGTDYYRVLDQIEENLLDIIGSVDFVAGKATPKFEIATVEVEYGAAVGSHPYFVTPGMGTYDKAWDEFVRTVNISRKKRTRKLISGHRYDTPGITLWYLGEIYVPGNPGFKTFHGFTLKKGTRTTIGECMKDINRLHTFGKVTGIKCYDDYSPSDLVIIESPGLLTDSGEDLTVDPGLSTIHQYWGDWASASGPSKKDFTELCKLLWSTSGRDPGVYTGTYQASIAPVMLRKFKDYLVNHIMVDFEGRSVAGGVELKVGQEDSEFIETVRKLYVYSWIGSRESAEKSLELIAFMGVDVNQAILEAKAEFGRIDFDRFDNLLKHSNRFLSGPNRRDYEKSITFHNDETDDKGQIRGLFKNPTLAGTVIEMLKLAQENLGLVSGLFDYLGVYQYNRRYIPDLNIKLSLQNIIDYLGGSDSLNDSFKEALVAEKFLTLDITIKRNIEIL